MGTIKERAYTAAWQIYEEIGLSKHSVERVSEIIAEKITEQKVIDDKELESYVAMTAKEVKQVMIDNFREWIREHSCVPFDYYNDCDGKEEERVINYYELLKWLKSMEE